MDSGIVCTCCGRSISIEALPACDYCGYINVGTLDDTAISRNDAVNYRNGILKKLENISVATYQYRWDEKSMEYAQQSRKELKLADGVQCDERIAWSAQEFAQSPDSAAPLVLEITYQYDGEARQIQYPIKPVRGESFWRVGVEVNARLNMIFHLGDKKHIAQGGEIGFLRPQTQTT